MNQLGETIGTIYEAALDPKRWYDTLRCAVDFVGGERGMVGLTDVRSGHLDVSELFRMDTDLMARWAREYNAEDPWADGEAGVAEGDVGRGSDLLTYEELERKPVFREIAVPVGAYDTCWAAVAANRMRVGFLSVFQGESRGIFSSDCVERMAILGPHLVRAARIHALFDELRERTQTLEAALDELSFGFLTCTSDARVVTLNRRAERLLGRSAVLRLNDHRLAGRTSHETKRLRALIELASSTAVADGAAGGGVVRLSGPVDGDYPMAATVVPLSQRIETPFETARGSASTALVVVSDPEQALHVPDGALRELYALTPAEAQLTLAIARGQSLKDYANSAEISVGTARWTLKKVLSKTGTDKQSALVSLVLRSLGPLAATG